MIDIGQSGCTVTVSAPAKVNLTLRVIGRRADGYHDLESVVAAVDLFDRLTMRPADALVLTCQDAGIPAGDENLVVKAARLLRETCGVRSGADIRLKKNIPAGRGFGGGSSDAAAALAGLNVLWRTGRSAAELACLGARLGSDVPLFFGPTTVVIRGRGERIESVAARCGWLMALAWPDHANPTADVYAAYDRMAPAAARRPAATEILKHLGGPVRAAGPCLVNDLEPAARSVRTDGPDLRAIFERAGAPAVGMTGSGSAYFALADTEAEALRLAEAARAGGARAAVARILQQGRSKEDTP